jgi:hypothetical protein
MELILLYRTPEYINKSEQFPGGSFPPPLWTLPNVRESRGFIELAAEWKSYNKKNYESASLPVYYIVAGIWYNVGRILGMGGGQLIYWVRFLNVPLFIVLVWFSYRAAQVCFPESSL